MNQIVNIIVNVTLPSNAALYYNGDLMLEGKAFSEEDINAIMAEKNIKVFEIIDIPMDVNVIRFPSRFSQLIQLKKNVIQ